MGMPSASIAKPMAFVAREMSEVMLGNLGLSWFCSASQQVRHNQSSSTGWRASRNEPSKVVSEQLDFMSLIPFTKLLMLPVVDSKAWVIQ